MRITVPPNPRDYIAVQMGAALLAGGHMLARDPKWAQLAYEKADELIKYGKAQTVA